MWGPPHYHTEFEYEFFLEYIIIYTVQIFCYPDGQLSAKIWTYFNNDIHLNSYKIILEANLIKEQAKFRSGSMYYPTHMQNIFLIYNLLKVFSACNCV